MLTLPITERQFTALMKVCGINHGNATYDAMRCVYVENKTMRQSAADVGLAYNTVATARRKVDVGYGAIDSRIALLQEARGQ